MLLMHDIWYDWCVTMLNRPLLVKSKKLIVKLLLSIIQIDAKHKLWLCMRFILFHVQSSSSAIPLQFINEWMCACLICLNQFGRVQLTNMPNTPKPMMYWVTPWSVQCMISHLESDLNLMKRYAVLTHAILCLGCILWCLEHAVWCILVLYFLMIVCHTLTAQSLQEAAQSWSKQNASVNGRNCRRHSRIWRKLWRWVN